MKTVKMMGMVAIMASLMLLAFGVRPASGAWTDQGSYMRTTDDGVVVDSSSNAYLNLDRDTKSYDCWLGFKSDGDYNWLIATGRTGSNSDLSFASYAYNTWDIPLMIQYATGNVAIGAAEPLGAKLRVEDEKSAGSIVYLENTSGGTSADVLVLDIGVYTPGSNNEYITFWKNTGEAGSIQGDGAGGVCFTGSGCDFAEFLPRLDKEEKIKAGDIVGIKSGMITRDTSDTGLIRVVSTAPIVLGNSPGDDKEHLYEKVAFLGQVPVNVRGPITMGDYIIPSGLNDGTGVALPGNKLTADKVPLVIGQAWEGSDRNDIKQVKAAVGFTPKGIDTDKQYEELTTRLETLEKLVNELSK